MIAEQSTTIKTQDRQKTVFRIASWATCMAFGQPIISI
jgi:hypothetical protein